MLNCSKAKAVYIGVVTCKSPISVRGAILGATRISTDRHIPTRCAPAPDNSTDTPDLPQPGGPPPIGVLICALEPSPGTNSPDRVPLPGCVARQPRSETILRERQGQKQIVAVRNAARRWRTRDAIGAHVAAIVFPRDVGVRGCFVAIERKGETRGSIESKYAEGCG